MIKTNFRTYTKQVSALLKNITANNRIMFFLLMFVGVLVSVSQKSDLFWDFTNYHYYNAFAFLHGRLNYDIVPASINGFFNPIIELPLYFYIKYFNNHLNLIYALQGLWGGLLLFMLYKICLLFFDVKQKAGAFFVFLCLLLGLTAQEVYFQIGLSTNEIPVAFFMLFGLYLLLDMIKNQEKQKLKTFLFAGLIMGIGLGLKQTVVSYCIASGLMLIVCYKYLKKPFQSIFIFALGGLTGYLIINGWFMFKYWELYQNPFFPFLNGIFHSPYFDDFNYSDTRFLPTFDWSSKNFLIYPFIKSKWTFIILWRYLQYVFVKARIEMTSVDLREVIYYTLLWLTFFYALFKGRIKNYLKEKHAEVSLYIFLIFSFFLWMLIFSIKRYIVTFEILGAILFVWALKENVVKYKFLQRIYQILMSMIAVFLICNPFLGNNEGYNERNVTPYGKGQYVYVESVQFPPNTLLKLYNFPTAAVIVEWAKNNSFRAIGYMHDNCVPHKGADFVERGAFKKMRDEIEQNHIGPVVIVYSDTSNAPSKDLKGHIQDLKICRALREKGVQNLFKNKNLNTSELLYSLRKSPFFECMITSCPIWLQIERELESISEQYFCRPLKTNLNDTLHICVPKDLKEQILIEDKTTDLN